jgi:hypothetical protein
LITIRRIPVMMRVLRIIDSIKAGSKLSAVSKYSESDNKISIAHK